MTLKRVAIYGGTFDPVHNGHIEVARGVQQLFELDELVFVPACTPPHKRNAKITSAFHRFAMLALATAADQRLLVSTVELDAPDRPYAVETITRLENSQQRLFFLIGADSWSEITTWYEWQKLLKMCDVIVVTRPGYEIEKHAGADTEYVDLRGGSRVKAPELIAAESGPRVFVTDVAMVDASATAIRAAARAVSTDELRKMMPPMVAAYIEKHRLYRN